MLIVDSHGYIMGGGTGHCKEIVGNFYIFNNLLSNGFH